MVFHCNIYFTNPKFEAMFEKVCFTKTKFNTWGQGRFDRDSYMLSSPRISQSLAEVARNRAKKNLSKYILLVTPTFTIKINQM